MAESCLYKQVVAHFKMKNKLLFIVISIFSILTSCENTAKTKETTEGNISEKFDVFYKAFYSDTVFQKERIAKPLNGKILEWHEVKDSVIESNWNIEEIEFISDLKTKQPLVKNSVWTIIESEDSKIEKLYIENSGFFIEREFKTEKGNWYLVRYDYSNL